MQETLGDLLVAKRFLTDVCPHKPFALALVTSRAIGPRFLPPSSIDKSEDSQDFVPVQKFMNLFQNSHVWIPFFGMALMWSNFMATMAGPGIGFEAHSRQGSGGEDSYGIQWFSNVPSQKWTVWAQKIVVLEDELPFEKAEACRCHVSFRGYGTSFGGRNYHSNRFKWMRSFHVSRPTWWPCNKWVVEYRHCIMTWNEGAADGSCIGFRFLWAYCRHTIVDNLGQVRRSAIQTVALLSLHLDDVFIKVCCFSWDVCMRLKIGWHCIQINSPATNDVKVCKWVEFIW